MPQMAPIWWIMLSLLTMVSFTCMIMLLFYSSTLNSTPSPIIKNSPIYFNKFKWFYGFKYIFYIRPKNI